MQVTEVCGKMDVKDFLLSRGAKNISQFVKFKIMFANGRVGDLATLVRLDQVSSEMSEKEYESEFKDMLEERLEFPWPIRHITLTGPQNGNSS